MDAESMPEAMQARTAFFPATVGDAALKDYVPEAVINSAFVIMPPMGRRKEIVVVTVRFVVFSRVTL